MVVMISYDLKKPGRNYNDLYEKIKSYGNWWHCVESVWLVKSSMTASTIRDELKKILDGNDKLVVISFSSTSSWATSNLDDNCNNWLKNNL